VLVYLNGNRKLMLVSICQCIKTKMYKCCENVMENTNIEYNELSFDVSGKVLDAEKIINHIHFVICNSCYWCASYFSIGNMETSSHVLRCHLCNSH
jgi:hypothetical protein